MISHMKIIPIVILLLLSIHLLAAEVNPKEEKLPVHIDDPKTNLYVAQLLGQYLLYENETRETKLVEKKGISEVLTYILHNQSHIDLDSLGKILEKGGWQNTKKRMLDSYIEKIDSSYSLEKIMEAP